MIDVTFKQCYTHYGFSDILTDGKGIKTIGNGKMHLGFKQAFNEKYELALLQAKYDQIDKNQVMTKIMKNDKHQTMLIKKSINTTHYCVS